MKTLQKKHLFAIALAFVFLLGGCSSSKKRIHLIGDSTMADYEENVTQMRGWGEMFRLFAPDGVTVLDHAKPGRSSRSFYDEGRWEVVKEQIMPGDIVLIQFAHNDEKDQGRDGADGRGSAPWTTYRSYLKKYIDETRQLDATPILVQPIVRRYFDGVNLTARACHNIGCPTDSTLDYTAAMRSVAQETNTPIIDLCAKSRQIVEAYGPVESKTQLFVKADNTHPSMKGAALFAMAAAEMLDTLGVWTPGSVKHPDIVSNPSSYNFGEVFIGDTVWQTFDFIDFKGISTLTPKFLSHREYITIIAPDGVKLATDLKSPLLDSVSIYTNCGANVIAFYSPRTSLKEVINLRVVTPSATMLVPIKAQGRILSSSEDILAQWPDLQKPYESTPLSARLSLVKGVTVSDDGSFSTETRLWPEEIDENGDRFIQMTITAGSRCVKLKSISLKTSGSFSYRMSYALGKDFYRNMVIGERQMPVEEALSTDNFNTSLILRPAQSLLIRIFPWSRTSQADASFIVKDVCVTATALE